MRVISDRTTAIASGFAWWLALASIDVAAGQPDGTWMMHRDAGTVYLQFGSPRSDTVVISFSCEPRDRRMRIIEFAGLASAAPRERTAVLRLTAGSSSVEYQGEFEINEIARTAVVVIEMVPDPGLFTVLRAGPTLQIDVPGASETIPLRDIAHDLAEFERACLGRL